VAKTEEKAVLSQRDCAMLLSLSHYRPSYKYGDCSRSVFVDWIGWAWLHV